MMKNKFLYALLAAAVLGFSLASCSKEGVDGTDPEKPAVPVGEPGYLSFNLNSAPVTRALNVGEEEGVNYEDYVYHLWMLLYDTDGVLRYAWELHADNDEGTGNFTGADVATGAHATPATSTQFVTTAREVVSREYQLVIIANPDCYSEANLLTGFTGVLNNSTGITGINSADPFYQLSVLESVNAGNAFDGTNNKPFIFSGNQTGATTVTDIFLMTNANGLITVKPTDLRKDEEAAETNPVPVSLDRGVAKIMLNEKAGGTSVGTGGVLESIKWGLENINKKAYGIRRYAYFGSSAAANNYTGIEETESNSVGSDRKWRYATDPNFDSYNAADFRNDAVSAYISWNANGQAETNWKYAYENTLDFATQSGTNWAQATTQVVLNAIITYDFALLDAPGNKDYYSWNAGDDQDPKWRVFTHAQVLDWMANGYPGDMEGLKALAGSTKADDIVSPTSSFFAAGASSLKPTITGDLRMVQDDLKKITFHEAGFNQYKIPIKHFHPEVSDGRTTRYGHYGVVRNNVYRVTLNSIYGPGTPTSGWLSADITINAWYKRDQGEDI